MARDSSKPKCYQNVRDRAVHCIRIGHYSVWIVGALLLGLVFTIISLLVLHGTGRDPLWDSPGMIFSVLTGIATLLGLAFAIGSLRESIYISRILTFRDLVREVSMLLREASEGKSLVKIVCFSPALGNISYPGEYERLREALDGIEKLDFIQMVCLDPSKLRNFYQKYADVCPDLYVQSEVNSAYQEAENLITRIDSEGGLAERKGWDDLPMFHMFFTTKKGIVFLPLSDYPYLFNTSASPYPVVLTQPKTAKRVEILGFVTKEPPLLDRFEECFEFYRVKLT